MMSTQTTKKDIHAELITRYKEYFESKLAVSLLTELQLFPAVQTISQKICELTTKHRTQVIRIINSDPKISHELFGRDFFGRIKIEGDPAHLKGEDIWEALLTALRSPTSIPQIMQVHSVFMYRIAKHLQCPKALAVPAMPICDRGRIEIDAGKKPSKALGLTQNKVFTKLLKSDTDAHLRGMGKFAPNMNSLFYKKMSAKHLPFASGLSSHTHSLMNGAVQFGLTHKEDLKEYLLACFVFLAAGGHHSFHEVMSIGKAFDLPYKDGDYASILPAIYKLDPTFKSLVHSFPDLLEKTVNLEIDDLEMTQSVFGKGKH